MSPASSTDIRNTVTMILAGGVGSRLNALVRRRAKPAVPFGATYRIIDFALSNVMNSGLERVGVLTQYLPYSLTEHIGDGQPWGLVGRAREARILPPHQGQHGSDWYSGTADAVYQNLEYLGRYSPEQVLLLSGDHVYNMDYAALIDHHVRVGADATIAVRTVPIEEASSFGTVKIDADGWINGFEEKPKNPTSNLISMGIYVFSARVLEDRLRKITGAGLGSDFGHHIFPMMMKDGYKLSTYLWEGYWQDVGTIKAYFDAQMDLIDQERTLDIRAWGVRTNLDETRLGDRPPGWLAPSANVHSSMISRGCHIHGTVEQSILSPGVVVEEGATVQSSVILNDCRIGAGSVLKNVILDKEVRIDAGCRVGGHGSDRISEQFPSHLDAGLSLIGKGARLHPDCSIGRNCVVTPLSEVRGSIESGDTVE